MSLQDLGVFLTPKNDLAVVVRATLMPEGPSLKLRRLIAFNESAARQAQFAITNRHETTAVKVLHDESADAHDGENFHAPAGCGIVLARKRAGIRRILHSER